MPIDFSQWLDSFQLPPQALQNLVITLLIAIILWAARKLVLRIILERLEDAYLRYNTQKTVGYVTVVMGILLISPLWIGGFKNAATYFGLLTAGLAIALQELIINFAGWIFIIWRRPFQIGDRIQVGNYAGDVIDQRIFQFSLVEIGNWVDADQSTGRIIHLPNGMVFREVLANYSSGFQFIWNEIPVLITFESNWRDAKAILLEIANEHGTSLTETARQQIKEASKQFLIFYTSLTPIVYTDVKDSGIMLTIRHICEPRKRRSSAETIWESILDEFSRRPDIDLAYPTIRYYNNLSEGPQAAEKDPLP